MAGINFQLLKRLKQLSLLKQVFSPMFCSFNKVLQAYKITVAVHFLQTVNKFTAVILAHQETALFFAGVKIFKSTTIITVFFPLFALLAATGQIQPIYMVEGKEQIVILIHSIFSRTVPFFFLLMSTFLLTALVTLQWRNMYFIFTLVFSFCFTQQMVSTAKPHLKTTLNLRNY